MNPKPKIPVSVVLLALAVAVGLVTQFLAARAAFSLITDHWLQPLAAAALIEVAVVTDALVVARSRNWLAGAGLAVAVVVSASYNYTQARASAVGLAEWQLVTLALGPLAALVTVALALGLELRTWGGEMAQWEADGEEIAAEALRYERHQAELARKRKERSERRLVRSVSDERPSGRPRSGRWPDKRAFLADGDRPEQLTAGQLADLAGRSTRTARRWLAAVREKDE